ALVAKDPSWVPELTVVTRRLYGLPSCIFLDLANKVVRLSIEIDGETHRNPRARDADARKEKFLRGNGWTVLRFWNQDVMEDLEGCVLMVLSTISKLTELTLISPTE